MLGLLENLVDTIEQKDYQLKTIDPRVKSYDRETDIELFQESYVKSWKAAIDIYNDYTKLFREISVNIRYDIGVNHILNKDEYSSEKIKIHSSAIYPRLRAELTLWLKDFILETEESLNPTTSIDDVDSIILKFEDKIKSLLSIENLNRENLLLGNEIVIKMPYDLIISNINLITNNIHDLIDEVHEIYKIIMDKILSTLKEYKNCSRLELYLRLYSHIMKVAGFFVSTYFTLYMELYQLIERNKVPMTEAADNVVSEASTNSYIDELDKLIDDIREFYSSFKYKEIITPRKKKKHKMFEYMLGALERKYKLKVPIYKVEGATEEVKRIVETEFITKIKSIVNKYPNFVILSPNWDEEPEMYIYITLREPFDKKGDREDREKQAQNEAALIADERRKLKDYEFGLPESRRYPLNDEVRIRKAIQFFRYCKPELKEMLASNIVRRIIELDLVGKVSISKSNPNKKYFPDWMLNTNTPVLKKTGNTYKILIDNKVVSYGTLIDYDELSESTINIINENGLLY